jgi:signal transduction histidine kinase
VEHLVRLVDDLLDVSRITRGKIILRREIVEVDRVVAAALECSQPLIAARRHTLEVSMPGAGAQVLGDVTRLAQVLMNLLNNAAKYTDEGGRIWLSVEREAAEVVVRVKDNGSGIPKEMLPEIFDLFVQVGRTLDRSQGGLGLGLTLVRRLVEMHGGTVAAHSEGIGRGSEFVVRLPAVVQVEEPIKSSNDQAAQPAEGLPAY